MIVKYRNNSFFLMSSLNLILMVAYFIKNIRDSRYSGYTNMEGVSWKSILSAKVFINGFKSMLCVIFRINFTFHITQKHKLSVWFYASNLFYVLSFVTEILDINVNENCTKNIGHYTHSLTRAYHVTFRIFLSRTKIYIFPT